MALEVQFFSVALILKLIMKILQKEDLNKVDVKFRHAVSDAWNKGEDVPYSVIYLSSELPSEKVIKRTQELIKKHNWDV